jgi:hypothetical protein
MNFLGNRIRKREFFWQETESTYFLPVMQKEGPRRFYFLFAKKRFCEFSSLEEEFYPKG